MAEKKCIPCEGGTLPLEAEKVQEYLKEVEGWDVSEGGPSTPLRINKTFKFKTFREAMYFVNRVANLAEEEQHHPDIIIRYRKVTFELTTHAIKGLSENDFIMASKIDWMYTWEEKVEKAVVKRLFSIKVLLAVVAVLLLVLLFTRFLR